MKVSGFTIIRNGVKYDFPIVEAITSILPVCDEFIVSIGAPDDGTEAMIKSIGSDKIKIVHSVWDDSLREGGRVLAVETDKALSAVSPDSDWAFYIQGDEVVHEKYLPAIRQAMEQYKDDKRVECLVLKYLHFYGNYKYVADSRGWYRREVRIIRNDKRISSYRDAQGFRGEGEKKLPGKLVDAYVYHYGWVRNPYTQQEKAKVASKMWMSDEQIKKVIPQTELFDYSKISSLKLFDGTHPGVMLKRIASMDWGFEFDNNQRRLSLKERMLSWIEKKTGRRLFEFRNYRLI